MTEAGLPAQASPAASNAAWLMDALRAVGPPLLFGLRLWASEPPYEIEGKYWQIRLKKSVDEETGIGFIHKPLQQPHPPIAVPAMSRNSPSMRAAGRLM